MKKIVLSIVFGLFALASIAQTNPTVTAPNITPNPIPGSNPLATVEFAFANLGPTSISNLDVDGNPDPIVLTLSLQNGEYDNVTFADPIAAVGGTYADHFTWTYNAATKTYKGTQNQPILGFDGGTITVGYKATTATTQALPNNGFTVNLTSNSNAPNGPGTNDTNDDNTDAVTYVNGPLPVTLTAFSVAKEGATAQLTWTTTEETNSDYFEIQRSLTGTAWEKIGKVSSNGESLVERKYSFSDNNPAKGSENLYRLKMVDKDETFAYSRIRSLKFDGVGADLSIYPNPVADQLFVRDFSQVTQVVINDLNGRMVHQSGSSANGAINVKNLSAGMYIVRISRSNGVVSSQKIVIAK